MKQKITWTRVVAVLIASLLGWYVWGAARQARRASQRYAVKNDLRSIMLALHTYHDEYQSFPPAFTLGPDGERWHSWRALLLPYLDSDLASRYRMSEPWNGPNNSQLTEAPDVFRSDYRDSDGQLTNYFAVLGPRTMWPAHHATRIRDIADGTSNTIAIVEGTFDHSSWLEPKDVIVHEYVDTFPDQATQGVRSIAMADGSARVLSADTDDALLLGLLSATWRGQTFKGDSWPADLRYVPNQQTAGVIRSAEKLRRTDVLAVPTEQLVPDQNQLWCGSFKLAWQKLRESNRSGGFVPENELVRKLNAFEFSDDAIAKEALVNAVSDGSAESDQAVVDAIQNRFQDTDVSLTPFSGDGIPLIRLASFLKKSMPFAIQFQRFSAPLTFGNETSAVRSFGHDGTRYSTSDEVYPDQLRILDDRSDDDCVIELKTVGEQADSIVLAMVPAEATLQQTWERAAARMGAPNARHRRSRLENNETLQIPVLDFSVRKKFDQLEGVQLTGIADPAVIDFATLQIQLRLDETGADLQSIAEVGVIGEFGEEEYDPERIRRFIFNKPFLIAIKENRNTQPWFIAWITDSELMEAE